MPGEWTVADAPTDETLYDVTQTSVGPVAVGTDGSVVARLADGWREVVHAGPATNYNTLTAAEATADGDRVWFCGSSGALGYYDVAEGLKYDYSAPRGKTSTWEAIAVAGPRGRERVRVANGSGEVLRTRVNERGCPVWGTAVEPGSGSTIPALTFAPDGTCYAVDTSGNAYVEVDSTWEPAGDLPVGGEGLGEVPESGADDAPAAARAKQGGSDDEHAGASRSGRDPAASPPDRDEAADGDDGAGSSGQIPTGTVHEGWRDVGVFDAQVNFFDVHADESDVFVAGGDGRVFRYDETCRNWTPVLAGEESLHAVGIDERGTPTGAGASGALLVRRRHVGWVAMDAPTENNLWGLALARDDGVDVAVGDSGTVIERPAAERREDERSGASSG